MNDIEQRLRDTNQVLLGQLADAKRREDRQRLRAEAAENRIADIERLTSHVRMERGNYGSSALSNACDQDEGA